MATKKQTEKTVEVQDDALLIEAYSELITAEYAKGYPLNKEWHVTTDRSVFLSGDLQHAKNHQKTLRGGGEVLTIKTK